MTSVSSGVDRRQFVQGLAAAGISATLPMDQREKTVPAARPNFVYIHSHDSGRYLGPYGHALPTPHLNQLASQSVLFRRAFSAAPTCSPSRAALLTGCYPHQNGMLGLAHLGWSLHDYQQHIIHTLKPAGYTSTLAGLQHIAIDPSVIGFDSVLKPRSTRAADVAPGAVAFLESKPAQPFFLDVGFFETHRPFPVPADSENANYVLPPAPILDTPTTREDTAGFHASASRMDWGVGQVMDALERSGLAGNTIVLSTTDHGIAFPEMKCSLADAGWGVSMMLRGPGYFKAGSVCDAMVTQLDIFPTFCELASVEKPPWLEGRSLLPLLRGETDSLHPTIFAEVNYHAAYEPKRSARTERLKYNRRFDGRTTAVLPNCDPSPTKTLWLNRGWQTAPLEHAEELYDLVFDPYERNNLAADPKYAGDLTDIRSRLAAWMLQTDDPLLRGRVLLPAGVRTTPVDGIDPKPIAE